jgi:hypothetical protein
MRSGLSRLGTLVVLVWIAACCELLDAAPTWMIPSAFFFNSKHSPRLSSQKADRTSTQLYVATDPFASSMGYWSPKQPRNHIGSTLEPHQNVLKPLLDEWKLEFWQTMSSVLQISLETLLGLLDALSKLFLSPAWEVMQNLVAVQAAEFASTDTDVAVDPGDFLCEHSGWQAYFDRADTCLIYYFHHATGVSQWNPPFPNFPTPKLSSQQLELAQQRYQHFHQSASIQAQSSSFMSQQEPLYNTVLKGVQDFLFQNPQKQSRKPDTDEDEEKQSKKPWWASMMDHVLESGAKTATNMPRKPSVISDAKAFATDDIVPFFAAFQDGKDITPKREEFQTIEPSADETTALSPLWDLFAAVVKMASAPQLTNNSTLAVASVKSKKPLQYTSQQQQPWDFLFSFGKKSEAETSASKMTLKSEKVALTLASKSSTKEQQQQLSSRDAENDIGKGFSDWMNDLPLFLTRDASRTIPLFGLLEKQAALVFQRKETTATASSPSTKTTVIQKSDQDRLKLLEEKRYAASRARQANLRRAYGTVIHDRSPTVSLTSIKLNKKKNSNSPPDWYKYLDD